MKRLRKVIYSVEWMLGCATQTPRLSPTPQMLEVVASDVSQLSALPRTCPGLKGGT